MPPGGQDRGAARAGAPDSLEDGTVNATALMKALPRPEGEQMAKDLDEAYFASNPDALSYVRAYQRGEVHPLLTLAYGGKDPESVAVAIVCQGTYARVMLWPGMLRASGRIWAEQAARLERASMGLGGKA